MEELRWVEIEINLLDSSGGQKRVFFMTPAKIEALKSDPGLVGDLLRCPVEASAAEKSEEDSENAR